MIDFEGEPDRPLSERKLKRSALRDVAGMLRSLHYAPQAGILQSAPDVILREEELPRMSAWADFWFLWSAARFLSGYFSVAAGAPFLPTSGEQARTLLDAFLLEKALYEIRYELNNRPDWVHVPIKGILSLLDDGTSE
jgi:trehalose synthase-fused probable maltokinase